MSESGNNDERKNSKYLHMFYPETVPKRDQTEAQQRPSSVRIGEAADERDKFRNPSELFKMTQAQNPKSGSSKAGTGHSRKPNQQHWYSRSKQLPTQVNTNVLQDSSATSCRILEMQWAEKMRQADKAGLKAEKRLGLEVPRRPVLDERTSWTNTEMLIDSECTNQSTDPWFSDDIWGEDIPEDDLEECLKIEKAVKIQTINRPTSSNINTLVNEQFKARLEAPPKKPAADDILQLLGEDDVTILSALDDICTQESIIASKKKPATELFHKKGSVIQNENPSVAVPSTSFPNLENLTSNPSTSSDSPQPSTFSWSLNTFSSKPKAKEFESSQKLSESQRKLEKATKSLPSSSTSSFTTDWLRNQLEKANEQRSALKDDILLKEGENKLLRQKLKSAEEEVSKWKQLSSKEVEHVRIQFEQKVAQLEKQLETTKMLMMFKTKEADSNLEKYRELKTTSVKTGQPVKPVDPNESFKKFTCGALRPGEVPPKEICSEISETSVEMDTETDIIECTTMESEPIQVEIEVVARSPSPVNTTRTVDYVKEHLALQKTIYHHQDINVDKFMSLDTGEQLSLLVQPLLNRPLKGPTLNHFVGPNTSYLPHSVIYSDINDAPLENYLKRMPTLWDVWGISPHVFGETRLTDYEKKSIGDPIEKDPAKVVLSRQRYFTNLNGVHGDIAHLCYRKSWASKEFEMCVKIVNLVRDMAREFYATMSDPRALDIVDSVMQREDSVCDSFNNISELNEPFDPLQTEPFGIEDNVDFRRGLVLIGYLCSVDSLITKFILNPRLFKDSTSHVEGNSESLPMDPLVPEADSPQISSEKTLPIVQESSVENELTVPSFISDVIADLRESTKKNSLTYQALLNPPSIESGSIVETDESLDDDDTIEDPVDGISIHDIFMREKKNLVSAIRNPISKSSHSFKGIILAPNSVCLSETEKMVARRTLHNSKEMHRIAGSTGWNPNKIITTEVKTEVSRKRDSFESSGDISEEATVSKKPMVIESFLQFEEDSPVVEEGMDVVNEPPMVTEAQKQATSEVIPIKPEPSTSAEPCDSFPRPKNKPLGLSKKHFVGPLKVPAESSKKNEKFMNKEIEKDIESMFTSTVVISDSSSEDYSTDSDDSDGCYSYRRRKLEIEHIPELVKHFHTKLTKAGFLEILCELLKDTGILRFTHKLKGMLLGTVIMLQHIIIYQREEAKKHLGKIVTVIREVLYTRPSPLIVYEVHVFIKAAVSLNDFPKMLCHNADPKTFVVGEEVTFYTRGACLMETICILMDSTHTSDNCSQKSALEMTDWVYYIHCVNPDAAVGWYKQNAVGGRRCSCLMALSNTIVDIFYKASSYYRGLELLADTKSYDDILRRNQMKNMILNGLRVLAVMRQRQFKFLIVIRTAISKYYKFIENVRDLDVGTHFKDFNLDELDRQCLKYLMSDLPPETKCDPEEMPFFETNSNNWELNLLNEVSSEDEMW